MGNGGLRVFWWCFCPWGPTVQKKNKRLQKAIFFQILKQKAFSGLLGPARQPAGPGNCVTLRTSLQGSSLPPNAAADGPALWLRRVLHRRRQQFAPGPRTVQVFGKLRCLLHYTLEERLEQGTATTNITPRPVLMPIMSLGKESRLPKDAWVCIPEEFGMAHFDTNI